MLSWLFQVDGWKCKWEVEWKLGKKVGNWKKRTYPARCGPLHTLTGRVKRRLSNAAGLVSVALTVAEEFACEEGGIG
uniref:Unclassified n=1 Tax=Fusarium pseudograminearum CS3487 TaxID=1318458 RepID=W1IBN5_FUSPS|nr:unclassified [Fusarium pseudograminearum CS3487]CDX48384.1 unclassified [Fusarium pseudograminearum CS3487]